MIDVPMEIITWMTDSKFKNSPIASKLLSKNDKSVKIDPSIFKNGVMYYYLAKKLIDIKKNFNFLKGVMWKISVADSKVVKYNNWKKIQETYKKMGILIDDSIKEQIIEGNIRTITDVFLKIYQKFVDPKFQIEHKKITQGEPTTSQIKSHSIVTGNKNSLNRLSVNQSETLETTLLSMLSGKYVSSQEKKENNQPSDDRLNEVVDQNISILQNNNSNYNLYAKKKQRRKFLLSPVGKKLVVPQKSSVNSNFQQEYKLISPGMSVRESENLFQMLILLVSKIFKKTPKESLSFFFNHNETLNSCLLDGYKNSFDLILELMTEIKKITGLISKILSQQDYMLLDSFMSIFKNIHKSKNNRVVRLVNDIICEIVRFFVNERSVMILNHDKESNNGNGKTAKFSSLVDNDNDSNSLFDKMGDIIRKDKIRSDNVFIFYMYYNDYSVTDLICGALESRRAFEQLTDMFKVLFGVTFNFVNFLELAKFKLSRYTYFKLVHRMLINDTLNSLDDASRLEIIRFIMSDLYRNIFSKSIDRSIKDKTTANLESTSDTDAIKSRSVVWESFKTDLSSKSFNKYFIMMKILNQLNRLVKVNNSVYEIIIGKMNSLLFMFPSNKVEINESLVSFLNMEKIELLIRRDHNNNIMEVILSSNKRYYDKYLKLINSSNSQAKSTNRDIPNARVEFIFFLQEVLDSPNTSSLELVEYIFATFTSVIIFEPENQMSIKELLITQLRKSTNPLCNIYLDRYLSNNFTDYIVKIVKKKTFLYSWENILVKRYIGSEFGDSEVIGKWAKTLSFMLLNFFDILDPHFDHILSFFNRYRDLTLLTSMTMIKEMIAFVFEVESKSNGASFELSEMNIGSIPDSQQINRKAIHIYKDIKKQKYFLYYLLSVVVDKNSNSKTREYIKVFSVFYNSKKSESGEETNDSVRKKKKSTIFKPIIQIILSENQKESIEKLEKHVHSLVKSKNALKKEFIGLYMNDQIDLYLFSESKSHKHNAHNKGFTFNDIRAQVDKTIKDSISRFKEKQERSLMMTQTQNQKQLALMKIARETSVESYKNNVVIGFSLLSIDDFMNFEKMNIEQYYVKYHYFFKAVYNYYLEERFVREIIMPDTDHNYKLILKSYMGKRKKMSYGCIWKFIMDFKLVKYVDYQSLMGRIIIPFKNLRKPSISSEYDNSSDNSISFQGFKQILLNIFCLFFRKESQFILLSDLERFNECMLFSVKSKVNFLLNYLRYPLLLDFDKIEQYTQIRNNGLLISDLFEIKTIYSYIPKSGISHSKIIVDNIIANILNLIVGDNVTQMNRDIEYNEELVQVPSQVLRENDLLKSEVKNFTGNHLKDRMFRNRYQMEMDKINRNIKEQKDKRDKRIKNRKRELIDILKNYQSTKISNLNPQQGSNNLKSTNVFFKQFSVSKYIDTLRIKRMRKDTRPKKFTQRDHQNRLMKLKETIARISSTLHDRNSAKETKFDFINKLISYSQTKSLNICKAIRPEAKAIIDNIRILYTDFIEREENREVRSAISKLYGSIYASLNNTFNNYMIGDEHRCFDLKIYYRMMHAMNIVPALFKYGEIKNFLQNYSHARREDRESQERDYSFDMSDFVKMIEWIYLTRYNELVEIYMNNEMSITRFMSTSVNADLKHLWSVIQFNLNGSLVVKYKALCGLLFISYNNK